MLSNLEIRSNFKVMDIISQGKLIKKMNLEYWWQRKYRLFNYQKIKIDKINLINLF